MQICCAACSQEVYEKEPFDTLFLNKANQGAELKVLPLDLPGRRVPNPFPSGSLSVRLVDNPGERLEVLWKSVDRVLLYEDLLYEEAQQLIDDHQLDAAYGRLARLHYDYPDYPGLSRTWTAFLKADAFDKYSKKKYDHALAVLQALYDRDPKASGVRQAVEVVAQEILKDAWKDEDYGVLGASIQALELNFSGLEVVATESWRERLKEKYESLIKEAETTLKDGDHQQARELALDALSIIPLANQAQQLLERIDREFPALRVGLIGLREPASVARLDTPGARRVQTLLSGNLAQLDGYGPSGGIYSSPFGQLTASDTGRELYVQTYKGMSPLAPYELARELLRLSLSGDPNFSALAGRIDRIEVDPPSDVIIHLRRSHPKPESLLKGPLPESLSSIVSSPWKVISQSDNELIYERQSRIKNSDNAFNIIQESIFDEDSEAIRSLLDGKIDLLANVPPWHVNRLRDARSVNVGQYRTPILHCLLLSPETRLRDSREARRAFCYAMPRASFVRFTLLSGESNSGFLAVTGPFPAGESLGDPLRYAYNESLAPRPHQPRLAAILSAVALKVKEGESPDEGAAPLVLIHPPTPVARVACRSLQSTMKALGTPIELIELTEKTLVDNPPPYDLRYAQLSLGEPMVDVWPLLGPGGLSGDCSTTLLNQLTKLHSASSSTAISDILKEAHEYVYGDLPLIPLWQTVDHYAYRKSLQGPPESTIELYQTLGDWKRDTGERR